MNINELKFPESPENIVGEIGENTDYHHFLLFQKCFEKLSFQGS